jgi:hypothetical protein
VQRSNRQYWLAGVRPKHSNMSEEFFLKCLLQVGFFGFGSGSMYAGLQRSVLRKARWKFFRVKYTYFF